MAQFQDEQDDLAAILSDEEMEPDKRVQAVRDKAKTYAVAWATLLVAAYAAIGTAAGDALYQQWKRDGIIPDVAMYEASAAASSSADALDVMLHAKADAIATTTHDRLDNVLADALKVGTTVALLDALHSTYGAWTGSDDTGGSRSDVIGELEGNGAWGAGQQDAVTTAGKDYGVTGTQTWNAVMDNRTRDEHAAADGQTVPLSEPFDVGGEPLYYPGDPSGSLENTAGCRCFITYDGQIAGAEN